MRAVGAAIVAMALVGCGGGGGGGSSAGSSAVAAGAQVQDPAPAAPASATAVAPNATSSPTAPAQSTAAQRPDLATATQAEVMDWNGTCNTEGCAIQVPPRSGRSLNWWGTDPRLVEQVNETCGPQPDCRVPDGDLMVWNFACSPQPVCRIRLSRAY